MSKKFNIHDWQAKQRLAEQDDYQRRQDALTPGKNPDAFYGPGSFYQKMKQKGVTNIPSGDEEVESMSNADIGALNKMVKKYSMDKIIKTINILKDRPLPEGDIDEHHGDDFPKGLLKKSVDKFLDDLKKKSEKDYDKVEDIMRKYFGKEMDETNSLGSAGAGASFQAGNSDAYATPKAFGKNSDKKLKTYKSIGYKKVKDLNEQKSPKWWNDIK